MITCTICHTSNHHLALTCVSCRGYLQPRVENIDLFSTIWHVIEMPAKTLREIAMAHHKNFSVLIAGISGIGLLFALLSFSAAGEYMDNLLTLFVIALLVGPFLGVFVVLVHSLAVMVTAKIIGMKTNFRNVFAVTSYSFVPIMLSVIFLLPIEVLTFGRYLFTSSPSPFMLKPVSFIVLTSLDVICGIWSMLLLILGTKVLLDTTWKKSFIPLVVSLMIFAVCIICLLLILFTPAES